MTGIYLEKEKEKYCFYRLYDLDFDESLHSIRIIKRYRRNDVRYALFRDIVISYGRPFSSNKGKLIPKHNLTKQIVPTQYCGIHDELLKLRNKLFAHTDINYRNPKVVNWSTPEKKWFPMGFSGYDYSKLNNNLVQIEELIKSVRLNLEQMIIKMELFI